MEESGSTLEKPVTNPVTRLSLFLFWYSRKLFIAIKGTRGQEQLRYYEG